MTRSSRSKASRCSQPAHALLGRGAWWLGVGHGELLPAARRALHPVAAVPCVEVAAVGAEARARGFDQRSLGGNDRNLRAVEPEITAPAFGVILVVDCADLGIEHGRIDDRHAAAAAAVADDE